MARTVADLVAAMERIAPTAHAADWDNVGLLVGARDWPLRSALLTIDTTAAVLDEAERTAASALVSYHPPIFAPVSTLTDGSPAGRLVLRAAAARIAVHSPHTALDAAPGGLGDWLAEGFGKARACEPLQPAYDLPASEETKLVTFVPADAVDAVRSALAAAGAGRIGNYELCSFELRGQGTFLGNEASNPAVGARGVLERVDEVRLEMVCPRAALAAAIAVLRGAHPYEEPPIEVHPLAPRPRRDAGQGRFVELADDIDVQGAVARVKQRLGVATVRVAAPRGPAARVSRIALCPGAGGELLEPALACGCELFFTGEMRHHDVLAAHERGCAVVLAGHTNTERPFLPVLAARLRGELPGVDVAVATADRWPLAIA
ncbi:MAG TPA: Nif3-like dinuclear metal center hexameric protein [Candidatus Binatia bacterium]|nr:Nif3-like dinuclear metal center hexameric protein [Candidatus Binatia bacterium]